MRRRRIARLTGACAFAFALSAPSAQIATAQTVRSKAAAPVAKTPPAPPAAPAEPAPPPYEAQLLRLAEIIGTLAYLRDLCGDHDGAQWRERMTALIGAEGKTEARKEQLAGAFNRGFRGYELIYRSCTTAADVVIARSLDEGGRIAGEITSRYGN